MKRRGRGPKLLAALRAKSKTALINGEAALRRATVPGAVLAPTASEPTTSGRDFPLCGAEYALGHARRRDWRGSSGRPPHSQRASHPQRGLPQKKERGQRSGSRDELKTFQASSFTDSPTSRSASSSRIRCFENFPPLPELYEVGASKYPRMYRPLM